MRARFDQDPDSIRRLFFDLPTGRRLGALCKAMAAARKVYRCVDAAELEKIAGTKHHGGVVAVVDAQGLPTPSAADLVSWAERREGVLVLDRIGNPHNLGAIARTAAFFGVQHLVIPDDPAAARPSEAAHRVAEGGLETLRVWLVPELPSFLRQLARQRYAVVGTAVQGTAKAPAGVLRLIGDASVALVLGNEEHGLAPAAATACTHMVTIPGTGQVESLNVSVAAAILIYALFRVPGGPR